MTCVQGPPTFRLLDPLAGWMADVAGFGADATKGLDGVDDEGGLTLPASDPATDAARRIAQRFGDPRLARGCGPCEWWLVARAPGRLLRRRPCSPGFAPAWPAACGYELDDPIAVAARRHTVAVADAGDDRVLSWTGGGDHLQAQIAVPKPGPLLFSDSGQLLVSAASVGAVLVYTPSGDFAGAMALDAGDAITHLALAPDCSVWAVLAAPGESARILRAPRAGADFEPSTIQAAEAALPLCAVTSVAQDGFCLSEPTAGRTTHSRCYDWDGQPVDALAVAPAADAPRRGQLLTAALDSGLPRCRWHRVRVEAAVPSGATVAVAVATAEDPSAPAAPPETLGEWAGFASGRAHPSDWQTARAGTLDFLVDQPPGRYLLVRLRLVAQSAQAPVVRRVRLDFPRVTSIDLLPAVYRRAAEAEDFTERFLSLFDASIADLDRAIERHPALLDVDGVPDDVLPWIGSLLDIAAEPWWGADRHRRILRKAAGLYHRRGTPSGLADAVEVVFGVRPAIVEHAPGGPWGALGRGARLDEVRLFGRARARLRVGQSELGRAPIRSLGDPDIDPLTANAHRFTVLVPPGTVAGDEQRVALQRLVRAQAPAHTAPAIRFGGAGFVLGHRSAVGVDTALTPLPAPVLGSVRLSRTGVLWSRRGGGAPAAANVNSMVAITTVAR
jgi:phage tail-like protein